ncbi:MAG TPA: hypothetical protein VNL14_14990 [Candidatus Acidoferrales bacterium]|nr:hypothetical protein [Candidatus Acidoferrales bacterium]
MGKIMPVTTTGESLDKRVLLQVLTAIKSGDFSARLPGGWTGIDGKIADTLNDIAELMEDNTQPNVKA